jgi:murein L,D-transpeptidase YafK
VKWIGQIYKLLWLLLWAVPTGLWGHPTKMYPPQNTLKITYVKVEKAKRTLTVYSHGTLLKTYTICLGSNPVGHKTREGDSKTPEGKYLLDWHNPGSDFYKSIHISYPNKTDREKAKRKGVNPGSMVMIHGTGALFALPQAAHYDWTDGCIALTDAEIDEIFDMIPNNTPIKILP